MPSQKKILLKEEYTQLLEENSDFILTRYSGLNVEKISDLRRQILAKGAKYKVIKNNIFKLALKGRDDITDFPVDETMEGPFGVALIQSDMPSVAKVLKDFAKDNEPFSVVSGVMESNYYDEAGINRIASLPSREDSLAMFASQLNSPATKTAGLMNQIMSSLARAIKAVGEKNG